MNNADEELEKWKEIVRPQLSSLRWEQKLFPDANLVRLEIELFERDLEEMRRYLKTGMFESEAEGWRFLLATGYAYLRGHRRLLVGDEDGTLDKGAKENLVRLAELEAMYAVMKQRAYVWMKDHQTMELQTNALHTMAFSYKGKVGKVGGRKSGAEG